MLPGICFRSTVAPEGFRWVVQDESGAWQLFDAPDDWPIDDYLAADSVPPRHVGPELSYNAFLASYSAWDERIIYEPELYLRFASERPTPANILSIANAHGFLTLGLAKTTSAEDAPKLPGERSMTTSKEILFLVEPAIYWIRAHQRIKRRLEMMTEWRIGGDTASVQEYLELDFNPGMERSLSFGLRLDSATDEFVSEIIAASMNDSLDLNWAASLSGHGLHRQCAECSRWFIVRAGDGRPEKIYCSDACKMRAYRRRKAVR